MMDEINEEYFKDKPYSFGGKYRLYDIYPRKDVDEALKGNDTYTKLNVTNVVKHILQSMSIKKESYFNQMSFFSQEMTLLHKMMGSNTCLLPLMCLLRWHGSIL